MEPRFKLGLCEPRARAPARLHGLPCVSLLSCHRGVGSREQAAGLVA